MMRSQDHVKPMVILLYTKSTELLDIPDPDALWKDIQKLDIARTERGCFGIPTTNYNSHDGRIVDL